MRVAENSKLGFLVSGNYPSKQGCQKLPKTSCWQLTGELPKTLAKNPFYEGKGVLLAMMGFPPTPMPNTSPEVSGNENPHLPLSPSHYPTLKRMSSNSSVEIPMSADPELSRFEPINRHAFDRAYRKFWARRGMTEPSEPFTHWQGQNLPTEGKEGK